MFTKNELLGKLKPEEHPDFCAISSKYTDRENNFLRKDAFTAFQKMFEMAALEGIELKIISAFRDFDKQKSIWQAKWDGRRKVDGININKLGLTDFEKTQRILKFSALPGTSRHHWGTDLDLVAVEDAFFDTTEGIRIFDWLKNNAMKFGFFQPYKAKILNNRSGYEEEKWHWSFAPISQKMLHLYTNKIRYSDFDDVPGAQFASDLNILTDYVKAID